MAFTAFHYQIFRTSHQIRVFEISTLLVIFPAGVHDLDKNPKIEKQIDDPADGVPEECLLHVRRKGEQVPSECICRSWRETPLDGGAKTHELFEG